jgi:hypothetical protein
VSEQDFQRAHGGEWISEMQVVPPIVSPAAAAPAYGAVPGLPGPPSAPCPHCLPGLAKLRMEHRPKVIVRRD